MNSSEPSRDALKELWGQRLKNAKSRIDFARSYLKKVFHHFPWNEMTADGHFAFNKAFQAAWEAGDFSITVVRKPDALSIGPDTRDHGNPLHLKPYEQGELPVLFVSEACPEIKAAFPLLIAGDPAEGEDPKDDQGSRCCGG